MSCERRIQSIAQIFAGAQIRPPLTLKRVAVTVEFRTDELIDFDDRVSVSKFRVFAFQFQKRCDIWPDLFRGHSVHEFFELNRRHAELGLDVSYRKQRPLYVEVFLQPGLVLEKVLARVPASHVAVVVAKGNVVDSLWRQRAQLFGKRAFLYVNDRTVQPLKQSAVGSCELVQHLIDVPAATVNLVGDRILDHVAPSLDVKG